MLGEIKTSTASLSFPLGVPVYVSLETNPDKTSSGKQNFSSAKRSAGALSSHKIKFMLFGVLGGSLGASELQ